MFLRETFSSCYCACDRDSSSFLPTPKLYTQRNAIMGWFTPSSRSHSSNHRPTYSRAGSTFSSRSSSYYKRRPRDGYIQRLLHKLKHLIREVMAYARRHPYKVFLLVIMPLISGGVLHSIARQFGIRLPDFLKGSAATRGGGGYYGSQGYGESDFGRNVGNIADLAGNIGSIGSVMKLASSFM